MEVPKNEKASLRIMTHNVWNGIPGGRDERYGAFYEKYAPDVLCLQEMSPRIRTKAMLEGLGQHYDFVPVDTHGMVNYTPMLVRRGEFDILECGWHLFGGLNDLGSKSITWAALVKKETGERFGVASNHFWWQEAGEENEASRIRDAKEMRAFTEYLRVKYDMPVLTMGDFNCDMRSKAYGEMLSGGAVDAITCAQVSANRSNTLHEYPVQDETGIFGRGTPPVGSCLEAIDHILVYDVGRVDLFVHEVVTEQAALDQSDHCPVYVDCSIRERDEKTPRVVEK